MPRRSCQRLFFPIHVHPPAPPIFHPAAGPRRPIWRALPREKVWEGTELDHLTRVTCGSLTCAISADPLSISVTDAAGKEVQHLTWEPEGKAFLFNADAPVFGLGQGGAGFDRRGEIHSLKDGWGGYKRQTHGSRVAIPSLISSAGWALMLNHLPGQAGSIDLRAPQFLPDADQAALPFDAFLSVSPDPLALIAERSRIEGPPPLTLRIYPGRDAEFTLYQDDGRSLSHLKGASHSTRISWSEATRTLSLRPADSTYHPDWPRSFVIEVLGSPPQSLPWDGTAMEMNLP